MVNSVQRLKEVKAFVRMSSGLDLKEHGWSGDDTGGHTTQTELLSAIPGIVERPDGELQFAEWKCRAGQNNVIIRTDGTMAPCFPMYGATYNWGNIDHPRFDQEQFRDMQKTCQGHFGNWRLPRGSRVRCGSLSTRRPWAAKTSSPSCVTRSGAGSAIVRKRNRGCKA